MLENESTVDAGQEVNVEPQETVEVPETDGAPSEVATEAVKEVQTPEENAKFKEIRLQTEQKIREAEQKAQDQLIAEMYGKSHGIYTKADYDKAVREQQEAEMLEKLKSEEVDPKEIYKALKENDPDYQELQKIKAETYTQNQIRELNNELKELELDIEVKSLDDLAKLENADKMIELIKSGRTLSEAYFLANKKALITKEAEKVRQETLEKTLSLKGSSPGALDQSAGSEHKDSYSTMSAEDFEKLKEDVLMGRRK